MSRLLVAIAMILSSVVVSAALGQGSQILEDIQEQQQQVFADLDLPWEESDTILILGGRVTEDWQATWATTTDQDVFEVETFCAAPFDLQDQDLIGDAINAGLGDYVTACFEAHFEISVALLRLESQDEAVAYATGLVFSVDGASGTRDHRLIILSRLDPEDAEQVRSVLYALDFEAIGTSPCFSLGRSDLDFDDPDYAACQALADSNMICRREKDKYAAAGCFGSGVYTFISCIWPAWPGCWMAATLSALCDICLFVEIGNSAADYRAAKDCCCTGLACRTDGGTQCPSPEGCNSSGCPTVGCIGQ